MSPGSTSASASPGAPIGDDAALDLYWIPLGAGARVVRFSGGAYEALTAWWQHRERSDLYHAALIATLDATPVVVEVAPIPDDRGVLDRGVVGEGPVGMRGLGRLRLFRYEVRRWSGGAIPDLSWAVASPVRITDDPEVVARALDLLPLVPTPTWGRDEIGAGDMWNSNSVVSWLLSSAGVLDAAGPPPVRGRAPGWDAGLHAARTLTADGPARPREGPVRLDV